MIICDHGRKEAGPDAYYVSDEYPNLKGFTILQRIAGRFIPTKLTLTTHFVSKASENCPPQIYAGTD